jgi:hypothetical protein
MPVRESQGHKIRPRGQVGGRKDGKERCTRKQPAGGTCLVPLLFPGSELSELGGVLWEALTQTLRTKMRKPRIGAEQFIQGHPGYQNQGWDRTQPWETFIFLLTPH